MCYCKPYYGNSPKRCPSLKSQTQRPSSGEMKLMTTKGEHMKAGLQRFLNGLTNSFMACDSGVPISTACLALRPVTHCRPKLTRWPAIAFDGSMKRGIAINVSEAVCQLQTEAW